MEVLFSHRLVSSVDIQLSSLKEVPSRPTEAGDRGRSDRTGADETDFSLKLTQFSQTAFSFALDKRPKGMSYPEGDHLRWAELTHIQRALSGLACKCKGPSYLQISSRQQIATSVDGGFPNKRALEADGAHREVPKFSEGTLKIISYRY